MSEFKIYACNHCGSNELRFDAWAEWDAVTQTMVLNNWFDNAYCCECVGECTPEEVPYRGYTEINQLKLNL